MMGEVSLEYWTDKQKYFYVFCIKLLQLKGLKLSWTNIFLGRGKGDILVQNRLN